jgi:hypothetical protein
MGPAIDAIRPGLAITRENSVYVVAAAVAVAASLLLSVATLFLLSILVIPAMIAFVQGMAFAGLVTGEATPEAGWESLKSNLGSLVGAFVIRNVLGVLVWYGIPVLGAIVLTIVLDLGRSPVPPTDPTAATVPPATAGVAGLLVVLVVVVLFVSSSLLFALGFQFLDVAVVVGGESATSALRASWRVFREDPVSTVGYSLLRSAVVTGALVVCGLVYVAGSAVSFEVGLALLTAAALGIGAHVWAFYSSYHVAYYDARMGNRLEG